MLARSKRDRPPLADSVRPGYRFKLGARHGVTVIPKRPRARAGPGRGNPSHSVDMGVASESMIAAPPTPSPPGRPAAADPDPSYRPAHDSDRPGREQRLLRRRAK